MLLDRAVSLTPDQGPRVQRMLAAAKAHVEAGGVDAAAQLLATLRAGPLDDRQRAQVDLILGDAAAAWPEIGSATDLYLSAARRLEPLDITRARDTYVRALVYADLASGLARGAALAEVARAARAAPARS